MHLPIVIMIVTIHEIVFGARASYLKMLLPSRRHSGMICQVFYTLLSDGFYNSFYRVG